MADKSYKEQFWEDIDEELPDNIADLLDVTIDVSGITGPSDPDGAIIETGKLAAKLNAILDSLSGLSLVELALRIGQKNVTSKLMLLAALEYAGASSSKEETAKETGFAVLAPKEGKEYTAWTFPFQVQRLDKTIASITCRADDEQDVALTRDGDLFTGSPQELMHPGEHSATFTGSNDKSLVIDFTIAELELLTYPQDGGTVIGPVTQISVTTDTPDATLTGASCTIAGRSFALVQGTASNVWKATIDFASFSAEELPNLAATTATFVVDATGTAYEKIVNFAVNMTDFDGGD